MMLPKIFGWIVVLHGSICVVIAAITMFHGIGRDATRVSIDTDLLGPLLLFGGKLDQFASWLTDVHHSAEICSSTVDCVGRLFDHAFELFFMYIYLPLTAMFATFVIDQTITNKRVMGILFHRARPRTASMPALENSENNRRSGSNKSAKSPASSVRTSIQPPKRLELYGRGLVYDDTFGLIPKDILDSWRHDQRVEASGVRTQSCADMTQLQQGSVPPASVVVKLKIIPPVRNRTPYKEAIS